METRANYVLIGVFTLAVVVGVFGFIYWFQNIGGSGERAQYRIQFDGSVSGLRTGAHGAVQRHPRRRSDRPRLEPGKAAAGDRHHVGRPQCGHPRTTQKSAWNSRA